MILLFPTSPKDGELVAIEEGRSEVLVTLQLIVYAVLITGRMTEGR